MAKMTTETDILSLAQLISSNVAELDTFFKAQPTLRPSSSVDTPPMLPLPPQQAQQKAEVLIAIDQLKSLLQMPMENLVDTFSLQQVNTMPALEAVTRYNIASKLEINEEISYGELSKRCQINEVDLQRLMRMLICRGLFVEPRNGFIAHNSSSRVLHDSPVMSGWLEYGMRYLWPVSFPTVDAMSKWPAAQELNETAFYMQRGETFWESLRDKENARLFAAAMAFLQSNPQFGSPHLVHDLDWDEDKDCPKLMVDVGGHNGSVGAEILRGYPGILRYVVQDQPEVIAAASVPNDLQGRLEFMEHDFFKPQPIQADVYLLRSICHDWSDKYASRIVTNLIPALKPGARVIVNETCMPDPGQIPRPMEASIRCYDLCMKQFFNSKERSVDEWCALFQSCDRRFKLSRVKMSPGSALAIIEFKWDE